MLAKPNDIILDLKKKYSMNIDFRHALFKIYDLIMDDDYRTLKFYGMHDSDIILTYPKLKKRELNQAKWEEDRSITVSVSCNNQNYSFTMRRTDSIFELERKFCSKLKINGHIKFEWKDKLLNEKENFFHHSINDHDIIKAVFNLVDVKLISLTESFCESFDLNRVTDPSPVFDTLIKQYKIPESRIKLFSDVEKTKLINENTDFEKQSNEIIIYYLIKTECEDIVKHEKLGEGSYGKVYKCSKIKHNEVFALKKIYFSKDEKLELFKKECEVLKKLGEHERIIKIEKVIYMETKAIAYILMEYISGGSLTTFLKNNGALNEIQIAKYAKQICEGLKYLHANKIIHRDIKGENILLNGENLKLCDFSFSMVLKDIPSSDFQHRSMISFCGTYFYMAPEIIEGVAYGAKAEIWAFGATLVEMITGQLPYHNQKNKVNDVVKGEIKFNYPEDSSDNIKSFISSCLQKDPQQRAKLDELLQHQFLK